MNDVAIGKGRRGAGELLRKWGTLGGFASAFLSRGAGVFVAPLWSVGDHPAFVRGLAQSVRSVRDGHAPQTVFGVPLPTPCIAGCCPNSRAQRPALCEATS